MRNILKILSILMVLGGLVSLILSICFILFSAKLSAVAGNGAWLVLYPVFSALASVSELIAGFFGIRVKANQPIPVKAFLFGLLTVALNVVVILIAMYPLGTPVSILTWILSLLVPVLFTIRMLSSLKRRK